MKAILLFVVVLGSSFVAHAQADKNSFDRMHNYLGTWYLNDSGNWKEAGIPRLKMVCQASEAENGAYCKIFGKSEQGDYFFMFSELLAYDQSTDSFHFMSYMDNGVTYGSGPLDENGVWSYTVRDASHDKISTGQIEIKPESMKQQIRYEDGTILELAWSRSE